MKIFLLFLTIPLLVSSLTGSTQTLSPAAARSQVDREMAARQAKAEQKRSALLAVPAEATTEKTLDDGRRLLFRQVAPPPAAARAIEPIPRERTGDRFAEFLRLEAERKPQRNISLSATVYDREVTEIRLWHEGEQYRALSNVAFNHLQTIGNFEDETAHWSFFGMVVSVRAEDEAEAAEQARRFGAAYLPRERPDTSGFTSLEEPEYLVYPETDQPVPNAVLVKLDAIHAFYLANEPTLAIRHQRREALAEAHRKWREENPPEAKDSVVNFWPIRSNSAGTPADPPRGNPAPKGGSR